MAKHEMPETPDVSYIHNEGVAHEDSDMSLGGITKFVIHLILLVAISAALMWWLFNFLNKREERIEERETRSTLLERERPTAADPTAIFPEPRLQTNPITDLRTYNRSVEDRLDYRWVDKANGVVSIPIEEAKKKLLEQGSLNAKPATTQTPAAAQTPAPDAGRPAAAASRATPR